MHLIVMDFFLKRNCRGIQENALLRTPNQKTNKGIIAKSRLLLAGGGILLCRKEILKERLPEELKSNSFVEDASRRGAHLWMIQAFTLDE